MTPGGDIANGNQIPGLLLGSNVLFDIPWTFLPPGTTAQRPAPSAAINYRLRFNTDDQLYEYYDAAAGQWTQIQESTFTTGPFITYTADASLPDAFNLATLANGILKQSVSTGVSTLSIAVNGTDYYGPGFTGYFQSPQGVKDSNGNIIVQWNTSGSSAAYYLTITSANAVVNAGPTLSASGVDPNIPLILIGKGQNGIAIIGDLGGNIPVSFSNGTAYQHQTLFSFADTANIRTVTFPDADGTVAFTSGIPSLGDFTFTGDVMSTATLNTNLSIIPNGTGNLLIGDITPIAAGSSGTLRTEFAQGGSRIVAPFATYQNNATGSVIGLVKSRSTTIGVFVAVQNGDSLGGFSAFGDDGTTINTNGSGTLGWTVSGAVSAGIVPTQFTITTQTTAGVNNTAFTISNAQIVTLAHALPTGSGGTNLTTFTSNGLFYASSASVMAQVTPVNSAVLITSAGGVPSLSTTLPSGLTIPGYQTTITPAALTASNDTNVTITLGGTPATALLQATSLTMGWSGQLSLARGGSNASLTASNGGIVYSTASAMAILTGTATANQLLLSGASGAPAWSTTTYPTTNAINTIMYASSANVLGVITPVNSAVLVSSAGGVPSMSTTLPNIAHGTPTSITLTNGTGLPIAGITGLGTGVATALAANTLGAGGITLETDGTFTPTLTFGGAAVGLTYTQQNGVYRKIGNHISFTMTLQVNAVGSSTGTALISGLPSAMAAGATFACFTMIPGITYTGTPVAFISGGSAVIGLQTYSIAGAPTNISNTAFTSGSILIISGTYPI
jgi:hypothetical protein